MRITELYHAVQELMESNQVDSAGYRYTRPAPSIYEQQWLWDSCFHAIIYCHFDLEMAKNELQSLLFHRGVESDGMIPHMVYWDGGGTELWGQEYISFITQPPMIADTALIVYRKTNDKDFLQEIFDPMVKYYSWLLNKRDHDDDFLISIVHPWESGWDASPRWDQLLGLDNPNEEETKQARFFVAEQLRKGGQELDKVALAEHFHIESVDYNAIYANNVLALAQIAEIIGQTDLKEHFQIISQKVKTAINTKMWDEMSGFYWDLAGDKEIPIKIPTAASFIPLLAKIPTNKQAQRLINHLETNFLPKYPIPTVAVNHASFAPDQYWRGSTWLNVNWFIIRGLLQYGYRDIAQTIANQSIALVEREGFREYYDPLTGQGLGSQAHSWSGIVLDMISLLQNSK